MGLRLGFALGGAIPARGPDGHGRCSAVVTANDLGLEDPGDDPEYLNLRVARQRAEAQAVRQSLAVARGNLSRAAELLGVTRPTLYDLLGKHSIDPAQFGRHAPPAADSPAPELPAQDTGSGD